LTFSLLDLVLLVVISLCVVFGWLRGIWRELYSLAVVVVAAFAAVWWAGDAADHFKFLADAGLRRLLGFISVFFLAYLIGGIAVFVLRMLFGSSTPGGNARIAGAVAGLVRGIAIIIVVVFLGLLTPVKKQAWWQDSFIIRLSKPVAVWIRAQLPSDVAKHFPSG
jgi:membrane protein required for colicin V production